METNTNSNQMAVYNILFAADFGQGGEAYASMIKARLEEDFNIRIGTFKLVNDFQFVDKAVLDKTFDIIICNETLKNKGADKPIGAGTILSWQKNNPNIRIILLVNDVKRSGTKLKKLFDAEYYNCLYYSDLDTTFDELAYLVTHGRTREEAFNYYDLSSYDDGSGTQTDSYTEPRPVHAGESHPESVSEPEPQQSEKHPAATEDIPQAEPFENREKPPVSAYTVPEQSAPDYNPMGEQPVYEYARHEPSPEQNFSQPSPGYGSYNPSGMYGYQQPSGMPVSDDQLKEPPADAGYAPQGMIGAVPRGMGYGMPQQDAGTAGQRAFYDSPEAKETSPVNMPVEPSFADEEPAEDNQPVLHDIAHAESSPDEVPKAEEHMSFRNTLKSNVENGKEENMSEKQPIVEQSFATNRTAVAAVNTSYEASVTPQEGYVVSAVSDTVLVVEIPGAHFLSNKEEMRKLPINLITPRM